MSELSPSESGLQLARLLSNHQFVGIQARRRRPPSLLAQCAECFRAHFPRVRRYGRSCFLVDCGTGRRWSLHVYYSPNGRMLEASYLWIHPELRGKPDDRGGVAAFRALCYWAEDNGVRLGLWAQAFEEDGHDTVAVSDEKTYRLAAWYSIKFGFAPLREKRTMKGLQIRMVR